jgi:hypothetical protein
MILAFVPAFHYSPLRHEPDTLTERRNPDRAVDQFGQVVEVFVSPRREARAARRFFQRAIGTTRITPIQVVTGHATVYPGVLEELAPAAWHRTDQYANNCIEADHGRLKARLWLMPGPQARPQRQDRDHRACLHSETFGGGAVALRGRKGMLKL